MEVLNEGCSLCLLVPAATVSCSSSAYRLCNCYDFFLSLTLLFCYSPLCDFSILHAYVPDLRCNFETPCKPQEITITIYVVTPKRRKPQEIAITIYVVTLQNVVNPKKLR